jgi:RNA polymerase sigma-70 factor (ECF subfamily)
MSFATESAEDGLERRQVHAGVRQLIEELPEEQREVVILRIYGDLSFKEIADITSVSINTALGRMRYGLINLRKMITEKQMVMR